MSTVIAVSLSVRLEVDVSAKLTVLTSCYISSRQSLRVGENINLSETCRSNAQNLTIIATILRDVYYQTTKQLKLKYQS